MICKHKNYKFLGIFLCSILFASHSVIASAISFQVIQHDSGQGKIRAASQVVENSLFDYFFDNGFIATNSPTATSSSEGEDKVIYYQALDVAKEGGCDYLIAFFIDYDVSMSTNPTAVLLSNISGFSWQIFEVSSGKNIASGSKKTGAVNQKLNNREGVVSFTKQVAVNLLDSISKN